MKIFTFAFLTILLPLFSGCASKQQTPDWVMGDSSDYKPAQYLIGRGQANNQEEARDRARADLSKIFQVAVAVESEDMQKFDSGAGGAGEYENRVTRSIITRTDQIVRGIQIVEMWHDPKKQSFHALAILPRLQTSVSLRQQIDQLDEATAEHIERSRINPDLFLKIAAASLAVETQEERAAVQRSLQVVDITGRGVEEKWNIAKMKSDLDGLLKRVRISPQVTADSTAGLENVFSGALAQTGFLVETGQSPEFVLQARMKLDDLGFQDGWYWQRGVLEVILSETQHDRVRGTKRWNIKGNAADRGTAMKRALNQADTVLRQELRDAIIDMATSR